MLNRKSMLTLCAVVAAGLMTAGSVEGISSPFTRINHLTFNHPVRLPGVSLGPGAFTFEEGPGGVSRDIVLVRARLTGTPLYLGFTREVPRPESVSSNSRVEFGEATAGSPMPIAVWYPVGSSTGHEFLYR